MNPIIEKAKIMLSIHGKESFHHNILGDGVVEPDAHNKFDILTDEEVNVIYYFTAVGSGKVYHLYKETQCQEIKDLLDYFDVILQKLPKEKQQIVYRMDTYDQHKETNIYLAKYEDYLKKNIFIKVPWALSVSIDNWNNDCPNNPVWAIELLPENTKAHSIYPLLECDKELYDQEKEVRFESNTIFQITSVSIKDNFPYIQMREINDKKITDNMCIKSL